MTTANPRLFTPANVGRGLLASLALESALFAIADSWNADVLGTWPAWRTTDDAYTAAFGA